MESSDISSGTLRLWHSQATSKGKGAHVRARGYWGHLGGRRRSIFPTQLTVNERLGLVDTWSNVL
jgi:hypothetical protein